MIEESLIGTVLSDNEEYKSCDYLLPIDFQTRLNQQIWIIIQEFNGKIDEIIVGDKLLPDYPNIFAVLAEMVSDYTNSVGYCAAVIRDKARQKTALMAIERAQQQIKKGLSPDEAIETAKIRLLEITDNDDGTKDIPTIINENINHESGLPTGFRELDSHVLRGLRPGKLIVIASRPGMGKTSLACNILSNISKTSSKTVLMFSLEMTDQEIVDKLISQEGRIQNDAIQKYQFSNDDYERYTNMRAILASRGNIRINDKAALTITRLKQIAAKHHSINPLSCVIIDYLQLVRGTVAKQSREQEVSEISKGCKQLAKDLGIPVIVLAQLNRGVENRNDKRPVMADLRDSGQIEQDGDVIMFLYRHEEYFIDAMPGETELLVRKNRQGAKGTIFLKFKPVYTTFEDV